MFSFLLWHKIELDSVKMSQNMSNKTRKFIAEYEFGAFTMLWINQSSRLLSVHLT